MIKAYLIVMTHWPVSGASFWYQSTGSRNGSVCHTFLVPETSTGYSKFNFVPKTGWKAELWLVSLSRQ